MIEAVAQFFDPGGDFVELYGLSPAVALNYVHGHGLLLFIV